MRYEERDKTRLELAELRQRLRWEPIRSIATFFGVAVVVVGLGVERCNQESERRFEVVLKHHTEAITQMTKIISDIEDLCSQTYSLIRGNEVSIVTNRIATSAFKDKLRETIGENNSLSIQGNFLIDEISDLENRLTNEFDEIRFWKNAVAIEGEWLNRKSAPSPDFEIFFGEKLLEDWRIVFDNTYSSLSNSFSILGSGPIDYEEIAQLCNIFLKKLNVTLNSRTTSFCEAYASRGPLCR